LSRASPVKPESRSENDPPAWKNTLAASVRGTISSETKLAFSQIQNFKKEGIPGFPETPRLSKTDIRSYVNRAWENRQKKGDYGENFTVFPRRSCLRAQILPYSLRFDPQVRNFKKEDTFRHDLQLSDRQDFPRFDRNLDWKIALRHGTNTLAAPVHMAVSLEGQVNDDFFILTIFKYYSDLHPLRSKFTDSWGNKEAKVQLFEL
jgi:hypothetical protein